ncbi:hypothetical protein E4T56_gene20532, partial [Termitomyces sp. T112]
GLGPTYGRKGISSGSQNGCGPVGNLVLIPVLSHCIRYSKKKKKKKKFYLHQYGQSQ